MGSQFFFHFPFQLHIIGLADGIVSINTQSTYFMLFTYKVITIIITITITTI